MPAGNEGRFTARHAGPPPFGRGQSRPVLDPAAIAVLLAQIEALATGSPLARREQMYNVATSIRNIGDFAAVVITYKDFIIGSSPRTCSRGLKYPWPFARLWSAVEEQAQASVPPGFRCLAATTACSCPLGRPLVVPLSSQGERRGMLVAWRKDRRRLEEGPDEQVAASLAPFAALALATALLKEQATRCQQLEFYALQAQIRPHFLLNALNTVIASSRVSPQKARRLLRYLATLFRYKLAKADRVLVPLREELAFTRAYLLLEKARFGPRLKFRQYIEPAALTCLVPTFCLQPLVENAIKHGLGPKPEGGCVEIAVGLRRGSLFVTVADDGIGMAPEALARVTSPGHGRGNGIGLVNVHRRLQYLFGASYGLCLASTPGKGTTVSVRLPLIKPGLEGGNPFEIEGLNRR